ncbi:hypothetical protein GWK47_018990 [Chionoecetes opilio]|uniref:C2H2-type domain-containing protein n=1 Tax=Chionoecetes opilio TaxID=41210 RepID=A0A8J4XQR9_CHIOP|nr:hypothetical protein GWK47_018990 [Chionoecetes opilio]
MAVVEDPTVINGQNTLISNSPPFVKCNYCKKDFTKDCSRRRHELNIHGVSTIKDNEVAEKQVPDASTVCRFCDKVFANSSNKRAHERRQHGINPSPTAYPDGLTVVICKECNVTFSTLNNYRKHLLESHQIESQKAQHVFTSEEGKGSFKGKYSQVR